MSGPGAELTPWSRACLAADVFALDPLGAGVIVRSRPGPARDAWLRRLRAAIPPDAPMRRVPASIADDRLLGGLDIAATLSAGRPVAETGVIAEADGGVLVIAMAERLPAGVAARIAAAIDTETITLARDGIAATLPTRIGFVALDEGCDDDEVPPPILVERSACFVDLDSVRTRDVIDEPIDADFEAARARLKTVESDDSAVEALVATAAALGIATLRAPMFALRIARAIAALAGDVRVEANHISLAAALALAPRATRLPAEPSEDSAPPPDPDPGSDKENEQTDAADFEPKRLEDVVLEAATASIPPALLEQIKAGGVVRTKATAQGKAGDRQISTRRGRPFGIRPGSPREGRISLVATLRAAAPWQPIRRREMANADGYVVKVIVRPDDLRIVLHRQPRGATSIFVVDASGSSALHRLAEIKGAIELLLADCYVRRDSVALIAFRGKGAEIILPPTRSLARARRRLAGLPGGGGTPLASGLEAAGLLAGQIRRRGETPLVVLMTDGHANVARDGSGGRARALEDALEAGRRLGADRIGSLAIDTSAPSRQRDAAATQKIAEAMRADYIKLPIADARRVDAAVRMSAKRL
jgi:magnesium chelatase subunit D